jgi:CxxC motif-containing protein
MFISRKYNSLEDYILAIENYVRGYCCKGEEFPVDAVKELKKIVNSDINGETSFGSIAHRLSQKLLTQRVILSNEGCRIFAMAIVARHILKFLFCAI